MYIRCCVLFSNVGNAYLMNAWTNANNIHNIQNCFPNKRSQRLAILQYLQELDNESRTVVAFAMPQIYRTVITVKLGPMDAGRLWHQDNLIIKRQLNLDHHNLSIKYMFNPRNKHNLELNSGLMSTYNTHQSTLHNQRWESDIIVSMRQVRNHGHGIMSLYQCHSLCLLLFCFSFMPFTRWRLTLHHTLPPHQSS